MAFAYGTDKFLIMRYYNNTSFSETSEKFDAQVDDPDTRFSYDTTKLNVAYIVIDGSTKLPIPQAEYGKYIWPIATQVTLSNTKSTNKDKNKTLKLRACNENDIDEKIFETTDNYWTKMKL